MTQVKIQEKIQEKKIEVIPKKRENIPYLISKLGKKNIITGLTRVIGTRYLHTKDIHRFLGIPEHKSSKIDKLTQTQRKNYIHNLNQYNFIYEDKDREEVDSRLALLNVKPYKQWRFDHGLPCRGQRTKTNASTAHFRVNARVTPNKIKKERSKANKKFNTLYNQIAKANKKIK